MPNSSVSTVRVENHAGTDNTEPSVVGAMDALAPLAALCAVARFHQVAADPTTLAHQLGLSCSGALTVSDLLRAALHLGLTAKISKTSADRLALTPLPALALMRTDDDTLRVVILALSAYAAQDSKYLSAINPSAANIAAGTLKKLHEH